MMRSSASGTITGYLEESPAQSQPKLRELITLIRRIVPDAKEKIAYGIPTFTWHGNLVHVAAYDQHIGFYPGSEAVAHFLPRLSAYTTSKGTIQFPLDAELPVELITEIIEHCVAVRRRKMAKAT